MVPNWYDVAAWNFPAMKLLMMVACSTWPMVTSNPTWFHICWMIWTTWAKRGSVMVKS